MIKKMLVSMAAGVLAMAGWAAEAVDVSGSWSCRLPGQEAKAVKLPGTLDEAGLGTPVDKPDYGCLSRKFRYIGQATYQREIEIPADWQGQELELFLERVLWTSAVSVDGQPLPQPCDSLATPHVHKLGKLAPGKHTLAVTVDNTMVHRIGEKGHSYGDHMQTIWNGLLGKLEVRPVNPLAGIKVTAPWPTQELRVEIPNLAANGWEFEITDLGDGKSVLNRGMKIQYRDRDRTTSTVTLNLSFTPKPWDEFGPNLYRLDVTASRGDGQPDLKQSVRFGFRSLERKGNQLFINGRPFFMRGNTDNCHFPQTGYPALDVAAWKRIFKISQQNGINFIRCHSWCPPQAAFDAADELGIYLQPETIWLDGWMPGNYKGLGKGDADLDQFVRNEMRRINDTYGNSPAYIAYCIGNEMGSSNFGELAKWISEERAYDPRRLYACSTARAVTPADDYAVTHSYPGIGGVRQWMNSHTAWDYEKQYSRATTPCIAHEIGQWPVYPDYAEIGKYTGVLRPWNLEGFRDLAEKNNTLRFNREFHQASLQQCLMLYKDEVEAFLRTPSCAGVCLLGIQDYSGQGEALIGWLDSFYDAKGTADIASPAVWFASTVPLASFPKYAWKNDENYTADLLVHHYGRDELPAGTKVEWTVAGQGGTRQAGTLELAAPVKPGSVAKAGSIAVPLAGFPVNSRAELEVKIAGIPGANRWPLWILPAKIDETVPANVVLTTSLDEAQTALKAGKNVVLQANGLGRPKKFVSGNWGAVYWSTTWFPGQGMQTLGLWLDQGHPAFGEFPAQAYGDWLWRDLCSGGRAFVLDGLPKEFRPVAMPVSDFHKSLFLGTIFEVKVGPGRLLVCGYDLGRNYLGTQQLRRSLLDYAASPKFQPAAETTPDWLDQLLGSPASKPAPTPAEYKDARAYIDCAAALAQGGDVKWQRNLDRATLAEGLSYEFSGTTWKDKDGHYWVGWKKFSLSIKVATIEPGKLLIRFRDPNGNGRTGKGTFEGRPFEIPAHEDNPDGAYWLELRVDREDSLDGVLKLDAEVLSGPNLMIDRVVLMPAK